MIHISHEGALFRGGSRAWPAEVWSKRKRKFLPYRGRVPKDIEWGEIIDETEAQRIMDGEPVAPEPDNAPSFWTVAAKYPFLMRLSPAGAEFFNRRTQRWHRWPGQIPPCVRMVSRADAWRWLRHEALGLDFGTVERPWREWPERAKG